MPFYTGFTVSQIVLSALQFKCFKCLSLGKLYLCPYSGIKMSEKYTYITRFYASYLHILFPYRAGRKKTLYFCLMLLMAASFAITFTPEYYSFVVLQFIIGAGCLGTWMAAFVAGMY